MKELIPINSNGLFVNGDKEVMIDSRYIAEVFDKEHFNVLRDIKELLEKLDTLDENVGHLKFELSYYKNKQNKKQPKYNLNRDAFTLLVMGYTTKNALEFKVWYINRFNDMENLLSSMLALREDYKLFAETLANIDVDNPYRFSTENDMIYKLATGMSARQWRKHLGLDKHDSVRPHLKQEENELILRIQQYDTVLMDLYDDYQIRKTLLYKKFNQGKTISE